MCGALQRFTKTAASTDFPLLAYAQDKCSQFFLLWDLGISLLWKGRLGGGRSLDLDLSKPMEMPGLSGGLRFHRGLLHLLTPAG